MCKIFKFDLQDDLVWIKSYALGLCNYDFNIFFFSVEAMFLYSRDYGSGEK